MCVFLLLFSKYIANANKKIFYSTEIDNIRYADDMALLYETDDDI